MSEQHSQGSPFGSEQCCGPYARFSRYSSEVFAPSASSFGQINFARSRTRTQAADARGLINRTEVYLSVLDAVDAREREIEQSKSYTRNLPLRREPLLLLALLEDLVPGRHL